MKSFVGLVELNHVYSHWRCLWLRLGEIFSGSPDGSLQVCRKSDRVDIPDNDRYGSGLTMRLSKVLFNQSANIRTHVRTEHGLDIESDILGTHPAWKPYRGSLTFCSHAYQPMTLSLSVVCTVEEAADREYTFIVCAAKCLPDVNTTSSILYPLLKKLPKYPNTSIVLLQNGIGITDDLQKTLNELGVVNPILSGCAWVDATAVDGGRRLTQHGKEKLVIGYHASTAPGFHFAGAAESLGHFSALFGSGHGGVTIDSVPNIEVARWRKVLW